MSMQPESNGVLVSDFDGTMTRYDFYALVREKLLPPDTPDYWSAYRTGRMTHFEALQAYFASIRTKESEVLTILEAMQLDPGLPRAVSALRDAGWQVVVTSAGCDWYIQKHLKARGVFLPVFANPGYFVPGKGLLMSLPEESIYFSRELGIDKAAVVRAAMAGHRQVAFAGDGYPDIDAAELVPAHLRFAKGALAEMAAQKGVSTVCFDQWSDIAEHLVKVSVP